MSGSERSSRDIPGFARRILSPQKHKNTPVNGGPGVGEGKHEATPKCFRGEPNPRRRFVYFAAAGKVDRPAGRNIPCLNHRITIGDVSPAGDLLLSPDKSRQKLA